LNKEIRMQRYVRFDWAMKKLLRNKANYAVLEGFLSELLGEDIKIQQILESESNQEKFEDKYNHVDVLAETTKKELIIIEVQTNYEYDYFQRILFGTSKLLVENIKKGSPYTEVKKVISVNIIYFDLGQGDDYVYHGTTNFVGIHKKDILKLSDRQKERFEKDNIASIFPEYYILKINQFNDIAKNTLDEWIYFLKTEEIEDNFKAKGLKEAKNVLDIINLSKADQSRYDRYLDDLHYVASMWESTYVEGEFKGEKRGIIQGRKKEKIQIARKALSMGMNLDNISELTGLTKEDIQNLKK
jgi:predicted transposase/invertase (TIGR01784 family)